jgi:exodeoxyribonuclease VII small subunit
MNPENLSKLNFEEALKRLEQIVNSLEEGKEITLDEMISSYSEGLQLAKICRQKLAEAELKVKEIGTEE